MPLAIVPAALQAAAVALALVLPGLVGADSYALFVATQLGIYMIAAIGLNLLAGYAGQVSLGHGAFVAIGAYSVALLTVDQHWSFWAAAPVGMLLAAGLGVLAALPAFRLSTWYFAFITLGFALVFEKMIVEWRWLTKGFAGVVGVPQPHAFGFKFGPRALYYTVVAVVLLAFVLIRNIVRSRFGRAFVAVRDIEPAALAVGASPQRIKLVAFVISAALAGVAGAFFAVQKTVVTPDDFTADFSIFFLLTAVLGGLGTLWGPIIGAVARLLHRLGRGEDHARAAQRQADLRMGTCQRVAGVGGDPQRLRAWLLRDERRPGVRRRRIVRLALGPNLRDVDRGRDRRRILQGLHVGARPAGAPAADDRADPRRDRLHPCRRRIRHRRRDRSPQHAPAHHRGVRPGAAAA